MRKISNKIKNFAQSPFTQLSVGLILLVTGLIEAIQNFDTSYVGAHHGVMVLGIVNILSSVPDIIEGVVATTEYFDKGNPPD